MRKLYVILIIIMIGISLISDDSVTTNQVVTNRVITSQELTLMDSLLQQNKQNLSSLSFLKDWASDTKFKLPVVVDIINNPLNFPSLVDSLDILISKQNPGEILHPLTSIMDWEIDEYYEPGESLFWQDSDSPKHFVKNLERFWESLYNVYSEAFSNLNKEEKKVLHYLCLSMHQEGEDEAEYKLFYVLNNLFSFAEIEKFDSMQIEDLQDILSKIDFVSLLNAAQIFENAIPKIESTLHNMKIKKRYEKDTRFGKVAIGSIGDDSYWQEYAFIYDPAGNDTYECTLKTDFDNPFFLFIDSEGDDVYRNKQINNLASVIGGIGIFIDAQGDDYYQGGDLAFSSLAGYFSFQDRAGDDQYKMGLHSLGAASLGISQFYDFSGNDTYNVTEFGEGFAGTLGLGIMADFAGNDLYFAGGKYLHAPLAPLDYRSLSQGFSIGGRPDLGGGIGVLYDSSGNDVFQGGVYAQGVGYWYALGILIDKSGNDFYDAVYYPQGSGIHLAGGFLYDESGEDNYYSKHGPGQGAGHDYGVGFLVDRAGNDRYSVEGGNGLGITNSVGVFLDVQGDDNYQKKYNRSYGYSDVRRGSGGLGIFMDTGGKDDYPIERCENDTTWFAGTYGFGMDVDLVNSLPEVKEMAEAAVAEVDSLADIAEIFALASQWGVGSAKEQVEKAGEILLNRDAESAEYIFKNSLNSKAGLVFRAINNYSKQSTEFPKYFEAALAHEDSLIVKNTIALIGELADSTFFFYIEDFLSQEKYVPSCLGCLGSLKTDEGTELLANYITSQNEKWRIITARSLKKIDSEKSREYLYSMKNDSSFLIRTMVELVFSEAKN